ncbi:MAG: DUF6576 domain-containing protein [Verrucomicrobiota bacterium]
MIANRNFEPCEPLTWVGRVPVYLATVFAGVQAIAMILTSLAMAVAGPVVEANPLLAPLAFSFAHVVKNWSVWSYFTYALINPPDIFFVIQLFMLAWFGCEVEKFLGRRSFAWLCGILLVAMPVLLSVLSVFGVHWTYYGAGPLNFAIFLAFVMIYPRVEVFFGIEARWIAAILMGINTLQCLAANAWAALAMLWWGLAVAALWLKFEGVCGLQMPALAGFFKRKHSARPLRVLPPEPVTRADVYDSVDPILEKIARHGLGSLTRAERENLERARTALLEKEKRN